MRFLERILHRRHDFTLEYGERRRHDPRIEPLDLRRRHHFRFECFECWRREFRFRGWNAERWGCGNWGNEFNREHRVYPGRLSLR
jgi:hypothetical protein